MVRTQIWVRTYMLFTKNEELFLKLSNRQYAAHRGCSENAVSKALKSGRITAEPGGGIEPEKADKLWRKNTDPSKRRNQYGHSSKKEKVSKAAMQALNDTVKEYNLNDAEDIYQKAKTAHEVLKAEIGKIELRVLSGELVDRNECYAEVFKLARVERDAWLNWPARVSAEYASILGVDEHELYTALYAAVRNILYKISKREL